MKHKQTLLRILRRRCPEIAAKLEGSPDVVLPPEDRVAVEDALVEELTSAGLDSCDEPTEYGRLIEELIDQATQH